MRKHIIQLLSLTLILVTSLLLINPLKRKSFEYTKEWRNQFFSILEEKTDLNFQYRSLSPSIFRFLNISEIKIWDNENKLKIDIDNLRVHYKVQGKRGEKLVILDSLRITHGRIDLYFSDTDSEPIDIATIADSLEEYFGDVKIEVRDVSLHLHHGESQTFVQLDRLRLNEEIDEYSFRLHGNVLWSGSAETGLNDFSFKLKNSGSVSKNLQELSMDTHLSSIESSWFEGSDQDFSISYSDQMVTLRKIKDELPLDLELRYNLRNRDLKLEWLSEDLIPSDLLTFKNELNFINPWLNTIISGTAQIDYNRDRKFFMYDFNTEVIVENEVIGQYIPDKTVITADFSGDLNQIEFRKLIANTSMVDLSYKGSLNLDEQTPKGFLFIQNYILPSGDPLSMLIEMDEVEEYVSLKSTLFMAGDFKLGNWQVLVDHDIDNNDLKILGNWKENDGTIFLDGNLNYSKGIKWNSWYSITNWNLGVITQLIDLETPSLNPEIWFDTELQSSGSLQWSRNEKWLDMEEVELVYSGDKSFSYHSSLFWDGSDFSITDLKLDYEQWHLEGLMQGRNDKDQVQADLYLRFGNYSYDFSIVWTEQGFLNIQGSYDTFIQFESLGESHYLYEFSMDQFPLDLDNYSFDMTLEGKGQLVQGSQSLYLQKGVVSIEKENIPLGIGRFKGNWENSFADLYSIEWEDDFGSISGHATLRDLDRGFASWNSTAVFKGEKHEQYLLNLGYWNDGSLSGLIEIRKGLLDRLGIDKLKGTLDSNIELGGTFKNMAIDGDWSSKGFYDKNPFEFKSGLSYSNSSLQLENIYSKFLSLSLNQGVLLVDLPEKHLLFHSALYGDIMGNNWSTRLTLESEGFELKNWKQLNLKSSLLLDPISINNNPVSPTLLIKSSISKGRVVINHEDPDVFSLNWDSKQNQINATSMKLLPVKFRLTGTGGPDFSLKIRDVDASLQWLKYILPRDNYQRPLVAFPEGTLNGNIDIEAGQGIQGLLKVENLRVETLFSYRELSPADLNIEFTGSAMTVPPFQIQVGKKGEIIGQADLNWTENGVETLKINAEAKALVDGGGVQIIYPVAGLNLDGLGTGTFEFYMDNVLRQIDGDFIFNDLTVSLGEKQEVDEEPQVNNNPRKRLISMDFVTGREVQFVLPNEELAFLVAKASPDQRLKLRIDQGAETLTFNGDLKIADGEIFYFNRSFYLTEGELVFDENQDEFNPLLTVAAELNTTDSNNKPVIVNLSYRGSLFDEFEPQILSTPSKNQSEILALLGQPVGVGSDNNQEVISSLVLATGSVVGQYALVLPFENALKEALNLDLVSVDTEILENVLQEQLTSASGVYSTENYQYNLWRYLDGTRLDLGKYLAKDLFISGAAIVNFDQSYIAEGNSQLNFDFGFGFEMATPFFDIGWSYQPNEFDSSNSDESFVSDTAVKLEFHL